MTLFLRVQYNIILELPLLPLSLVFFMTFLSRKRYIRRTHNSSVVVLIKKVRYVLFVHRPAFFINTPSYNRDCLEYIHKSETYERSKYKYSVNIY
jgi:hypothetical protein